MVNEPNLKKWFLFLGLILIVLSAVNATLGNASGGSICLVAGMLTVILFQFDVKSFKVFGLAAELREKLTEAEEILDKLRAISIPVSEIAISAASQSGSYQQPLSREQLYDYVLSISDALQKMKVSNQKIQGVKHGWYAATAINMAIPILQAIRYKITSRLVELEEINGKINSGLGNYSAEETKEFESLYTSVQVELHDFDESANLSYRSYREIPGYLRGFIANLESLTIEDKNTLKKKYEEQLLDLDHLIERQELRRPEVWLRG